MIENIDRINKIMPLGTNLYYNNGNVDALYGPYKAPDDIEDDKLYFEFNGKRFPENDYFQTKLEYVKELSKFYLTQKGCFNLGRKVLLIDDNNDPIEYTVAYNSNQQLELITSDELEIYTIRFNSLDAEGAMIEYKVYGDFFNLPESKFIAPKYMTSSGIREQIFKGWRIGKPSTNSEINFEFSDTYSVYKLINLSEQFHFVNEEKIVDLYTEYVIPEEVTVDFEPIVYETEIIDDTTQPNENFSTYVKLEQYSNDGTSENIKPDDWDYNYKSYFVKDNKTNYDTYQEISYEKVYNLDNDDYLNARYEWKSSNFKTWYGEENWKNNQSPVSYKDLIPLNENGPEYVWIKSNSFSEYLDYGVMRYIQRKWYKRIQKSDKMVRYISCTDKNWDEYKNKDLYSHVIVNKLSMFSNGQLYGDVLYDTFDAGLITANTGSTIQISSEMKEPYKTKYMFDHWLIEGYETIDSTKSQCTHKYTTSTTTFIFDDIKNNQSSNDEYCDFYKIKAIYKKRPTYCKLFLTTNSNANNELGNTCIYGMVKNKNINKADINNGVILTNTSISIETRVKLCEITSTGEYRIMENIPGVNIETISLWGDNNTTTYFKIDTERYPTIQIVGEPVIDDKETPNKPLFYKWTGCIENSSNTIDLSLVIGGIYEIKSWFILDGDLMAKVHLLRYSGEFGKIMGVNVGIYGWKYSMLEKTDKGITIKDESPTPNYLSYNTTSVFDINSVQNYNKRTITGLNYVATSRDVNANLTPLLNTQVFTKTIDENNQLDTNGIAYIDITNNENGCYLYINVSNEASHEFVGFGDDDTNYTTEILTDSIKYIRYIEVSAPLDYSFIANFRKKTNTESSDTTTIKDSFTSLNDMVKDIKMNFSATKNTDTNNISTINKKAVNSGGIKTGVSVGGSIYVGENAFKEASDNKTTLPIILMEDDINQQTVYVEVENINDIINNSNNIDIATNNTTINSIINIASQNAGKTSTEELSVSYDTQLNRQSTVTNTSFKNTTISFNNKII